MSLALPAYLAKYRGEGEWAGRAEGGAQEGGVGARQGWSFRGDWCSTRDRALAAFAEFD